jgi:putative transposase
LLAAHTEHPFYGVERLAIHLSWSEMKTRRIRNLAGVVIPTASKRHRYREGRKPEIAAPGNALRPYARFKDPARPQDGMSYAGMTQSGAWVQDFTYLKFQGAWYYLAGVLRLDTREILGWRLGANHSSELTYAALLDALSKHPIPAILHSDQGSEYLSRQHELLCNRLEIALSCSDKSSPWQNGFMERLVLTVKFELGNLNRYKDLGQLHEAIALQIHYYNTKRIHTALKTSPAAYAARLKTGGKSSERVLQKVRG